MDDLDRLFHRLVHNIRTRNPAHLSLPFTVAELYEQLVPYRHNRRELGIETNQDYETAVMRLLSGERGYVASDPAMQESLRNALTGVDADTGAFREYATAEVSLSQTALAQSTAGAAQTAGAPAAPAPAAAAPEDRAPPAAAVPPGGDGDAAPAGEPAGGQVQTTAAPGARSGAGRSGDVLAFTDFSVAEGCRFCGATLPEGRPARFCPSCGQDLTVNRCPACGDEVEAGWRYCITCGRPTGT